MRKAGISESHKPRAPRGVTVAEAQAEADAFFWCRVKTAENLLLVVPLGSQTSRPIWRQ